MTNLDYENLEDFFKLNEGDKENESLRPIYYLKMDGISKLNDKNQIHDKAKNKFIDNIINNIKTGDKLVLYCITAYLIKYNILDIQELLEILKHLDLESLNIIANSSNLYSYKQMKRKIENLNENSISNLLNPLIEVLENMETDYDSICYEVEMSIKYKIYEIYNIMINESYELLTSDDNSESIQKYVYMYNSGLIVVIIVDEKNINFEYSLHDKRYKKDIKNVFQKNSNVFFKYYEKILYSQCIPDIVYTEIKKCKKADYICNNDKIGVIEFFRNEDEDDYELHAFKVKCNAFDIPGLEKIIFYIESDSSRVRVNTKLLKLYEESLEKLYDLQNEIIKKSFEGILQICHDWEEVDKNGNEITIEYIKKNFSFTLEITSELSPKKISFRINGFIASDSDDTDLLLGDHTVIVDIELSSSDYEFSYDCYLEG